MRWALRAVALLAPVLALLGTGLATRWPAIWLIVVVALFAAGGAALPDSILGTVALVLVVIWWAVAVRHDVPIAAVPAAVLLLAAHLAGLLLAYGPSSLRIDRWLARTWLRRGALVALAAPAVWGLAVLVRDQPEPPGVWVAGLAAAVAACLVAGAAVEEPR